MTLEKTDQAKPNVVRFGGFGTDAASTAASASTIQQNGIFGPALAFGAPAAFTFGSSAALRPGENQVNNTSLWGAPNSNNASAPPAGSVPEWSNDTSIDKYWCTSCKWWAEEPFSGFFCSACSNFYHHQCNGIFSFGGAVVQLVDYFGLDVCKNCHSQLQDSTPAPFPITQPLCHIQVNEIEADERLMPRKSSRDPKEIPRSETPDQVAIIAEHFATEPTATSPNSTSETLLDEPDELIIEALFEANDLVTLLILPQEHPDHSRSFKIVARHFNSREYPGDDADDGMDVGGIEEETHLDDSVTNKLEEDTIDDFLGKAGWFYKLDRNPQSDIAMLPNVVLWHEDDLELALDDDSDDEEDLEMDDTMEMKEKENVIVEEITVKEETVVEETIIEEVVINNPHHDA